MEKPSTRLIEIDPNLVDAIKLPEGDPRKAVIGVWRQVKGSNDPDFAHGGYASSTLTFRTDGVLEVSRQFGAEGDVDVHRQLTFSIKGSSLVLEAKKGTKQADVDLTMGKGSDGASLIARRPTTALPATLTFSATKDSLVVGGRTYQRVAVGPGK